MYGEHPKAGQNTQPLDEINKVMCNNKQSRSPWWSYLNGLAYFMALPFGDLPKKIQEPYSQHLLKS